MLGRSASLLSAVLFGLLSGVMLVIAVAFVPFWRALTAAEFRAWFASHSFPVTALVFSLGGAATIAATAALLAGLRSSTRTWLVVAAAAAVGVSMVTLFATEPANILFVTPGAITDARTDALLREWGWWNWGRVLLSIIGFAAALQVLAHEEKGRSRRRPRRRPKR